MRLFDFVLIQETWCDNETDLRQLEGKLTGFKCYTESATRVSKFGRASGGLAVYFKKEYDNFVKRLDAGFKHGITLEIQTVLNGAQAQLTNLILVCVYLPPENSTSYGIETNGVEVLKDKLVDLKSRFPDHMLGVAGDLNARIGVEQDYIDDRIDHMIGMDWYEPDNFDIPRQSKDSIVNNFGQSLLNVCTELDIHVLNGRAQGDSLGQYTNISVTGCSTVDYIIVESPLYSRVVNFTVGDLAVSNHMPVHCKLDLYVQSGQRTETNINESDLPQQCKFRWNNECRGQYIETMKDDVSVADLGRVQEQADANNVDEALEIFESVLHRAAEPMKIKVGRKSKFKCLQPKWWDKECERLKRVKYKLLKCFKETDCIHDFNAYKEARRNFKNHCTKSKNEWKDGLRQKLVDCRHDAVQFWKVVKSINSKHLYCPAITAAEWFAYFETLLNQEVNINREFAEFVQDFTTQHDAECNVCTGQHQGDIETQELNAPITREEIVNCIKSMSNGKSGGIDGVIIEMLKSSLDLIEPYLRHMYNAVLESGKYPEQWTKAILVPLHKKGSTSDLDNYRGIALLSVLGKVFSKVVNNRLVNWAEDTGIQKEEQAGFRKRYSTVDNIFVLQSLIQKYCSKKAGRFYVLYVDFSKAFDTIPHALLFYQLMSKGVHGKILKVLRSMYGSLQSSVRTPNGLTDFFKCERGTRQGCMLSPFLFSLYVGELVNMFEENQCEGVYINESTPNISCLLFADDLVTCADTVGRLQHMIDVVVLFCKKWGLEVNLDKTKVMVFRNGGPLRENEKWWFCGKPLKVVNGYKYLGTVFTPKLVWTQCQKTLASQARKGLYLLRKYNYACNTLPIDVQFELFDSMISPILLYSAEIWGFDVADNIEKVHIGFCKYVLGVPSHTCTVAVLAETGRHPMYIHYYKRCIKYWLKLLNMPESRYPKACYTMLYSLDQQGRTTWASAIRQLLCKYGYQEVWEAQRVENRTVFLREFSQKVLETFNLEWEESVAQSSKLSLFRELKPDGIGRESYLFNVTIKKYRASIAKIRCSAHELRIEKGRHKGELMADRVCKLCLKEQDQYILEDEFHLFTCPSYSELRTKYLPELAAGQFTYEMFIELLRNENENVQINSASYVYQAFKRRLMLLQEP